MNNATRVPVLMYHQVGEPHNDWEARYFVTSNNFAAHARALVRNGYSAVSIDALVDWLEGGPPLKQGALLLTFDDGFRGVREHALPVLKEFGWPFTVFLVSDLIGKEDVWNRVSNPSGVTYPLLDAHEIREMQGQGVCFNSHTRNHASLPTLNDAQLVEQLVGSRNDLIRLLGHDVPYIAYPFGHLDDRVEAATRAAGQSRPCPPAACGPAAWRPPPPSDARPAAR